jgi:hypothetical protein
LSFRNNDYKIKKDKPSTRGEEKLKSNPENPVTQKQRFVFTRWGVG